MNDKNAQIILYLIENKNKEINILKISQDLKIDYKNVHTMVKRLETGSLVKLESFGQSKRVTLIARMHPLIFEAEYQRKEKLLKDKNIRVMLHDFKRGLSSKYYILLLFGSYARRRQTRSSDIDLMFIVPNGTEEFFEGEVHQTTRSSPLPIHALVFSEKQFLEMVHSPELNVGREALKNNVILYGIETYYELV